MAGPGELDSARLRRDLSLELRRRITLYAGGGSIGRPRQDVAAMLGLPKDMVRVVARDVGGNFGTRNSSYLEFSLVAWAARRLGRPVKWTGERQEAFLSDHQARDLRVEAELAPVVRDSRSARRRSTLSLAATVARISVNWGGCSDLREACDEGFSPR